MKCPHCDAQDLIMSDRQGIEIDYCPRCRGVWLDRGELDKIIERSTTHENERYRRDDDNDDEDRRRYDRSPQGQGYPPQQYPPHQQHKKKSFWSELFD